MKDEGLSKQFLNSATGASKRQKVSQRVGAILCARTLELYINLPPYSITYIILKDSSLMMYEITM
jgi:hypothetical protein